MRETIKITETREDLLRKRTSDTLEFLQVAYTKAELLTLADAMARADEERERLEEQLEVVKTDFKHKLEAVESTLKDLRRKYRRGNHWENVDCFYILEDPTPNEKTLVRRDTGELMRVVPMDPRDYQDPLPIAMKPEQPMTAADSPDRLVLESPSVNGKDTEKPAPRPVIV